MLAVLYASNAYIFQSSKEFPFSDWAPICGLGRRVGLLMLLSIDRVGVDINAGNV